MDLESIILSPAFTALLAGVGLYLFAILSREFFLWFLKLNQFHGDLNKKLDEMNDQIRALAEKLEAKTPTEDRPTKNTVSLPPLPLILKDVKTDTQKQQFPVTH